MKKAVFKTNINCAQCVAKVTPYLEQAESIEKWEVDTNDKDKLLKVSGNSVDITEVKRLIEEAGYEAREKKSLLGWFN